MYHVNKNLRGHHDLHLHSLVVKEVNSLKISRPRNLQLKALLQRDHIAEKMWNNYRMLDTFLWTVCSLVNVNMESNLKYILNCKMNFINTANWTNEGKTQTGNIFKGFYSLSGTAGGWYLPFLILPNYFWSVFIPMWFWGWCLLP